MIIDLKKKLYTEFKYYIKSLRAYLDLHFNYGQQSYTIFPNINKIRINPIITQISNLIKRSLIKAPLKIIKPNSEKEEFGLKMKKINKKLIKLLANS